MVEQTLAVLDKCADIFVALLFTDYDRERLLRLDINEMNLESPQEAEVEGKVCQYLKMITYCYTLKPACYGFQNSKQKT